MEKYSYPLALTQQFRFCGNPFRIDTYYGCDYGCSYCFANSKLAKDRVGEFGVADIDEIERLFEKILVRDEPSVTVTSDCLRHRVPLHLGGMSDPFQKREFEIKNTLKFLKVSKKYNYPVVISTKAAFLPDEYLEVLDPNIHAFQVSIMGYTKEFIREFEGATPLATERVDFISQLRELGFWVSCRIQPLISLSEAKILVIALGGNVDYITVEHIKVPVDNLAIRKVVGNKIDYKFSLYRPKFGRHFEVLPSIKEKNIKAVKDLAVAPVGVGDNDLHHLSDSACCCGIDTINGNFNNWLKYNTLFFEKNPNKPPSSIWTPKGNCSTIFSSKMRPGMPQSMDYRDIVDDFNKKYDEKKGVFC